jgi:pimeloyl-ACP methyl ester carboxylesterase
MNDLELIRNIEHPNPDKPDLLFLHGMSAGAWIWEEGALPLFGAAGYRAWALSLSGHGGSPGVDRIHHYGLDQYSSDLAHALDRIERPCVVVAHSLGGAVAQNLLRRGRRFAGTVLLCSVPPYGMWRASLEAFWLNPVLWKELVVFSLFGLERTNIDVLRANLFPGGVDDAVFLRLLNRAQDESLIAMHGAIGWPPFAPPPLSQANMLVIGGMNDSLVPPLDVTLTAAYYGVRPHLLEGAGHMLMYEPAGHTAAQLVLDWLAGLNAGLDSDHRPGQVPTR